MSEDALIRRQNLISLGRSAKELSARVGGRYTYWRDLMVAPGKSFGEKTARKVEEALDLPRGWLDQPHDGPPPLVAKENPAPYTAKPQAKVVDPTAAQLSKKATILAMMFDEISDPAERDRCYIQCQQIMLGFDPSAKAPAQHAAAPIPERASEK